MSSSVLTNQQAFIDAQQSPVSDIDDGSSPTDRGSNPKPNLTRTATTPSTFDTPPRSHDLQRQMSASATPTSSNFSILTSYLRHILGMGSKTTKRSLSEEAESGSPDSVGEWLRSGSNPNENDAYGYTPLVNACMRGCVKSVKALLSYGAEVNLKACHGYTPLHAASQNGFVEVVEILIDNGADLEVKNDDGDTPLMLAVRSEHAAVVDLLCQRGCNMHAHGFDDIDPLDYALNKRNLYLSDVLMKHERQHLNSVSSTNSEPTSGPNHLNSPTLSANAAGPTATKISNITTNDEIASTPTINNDDLSVINKNLSDKLESNSNSLNEPATTNANSNATSKPEQPLSISIAKEGGAVQDLNESQNVNDSVFHSED